MKIYMLNGYSGPRETEVNTVFDAVNLLTKEEVEDFLLIYCHTYIVFNEWITDGVRKRNKETFDNMIKNVFDLYYNKKRLAPIEYVERIAFEMNEIVPDYLKDEIIAICIGIFKSRDCKNWLDGLNFYDEIENMKSRSEVK